MTVETKSENALDIPQELQPAQRLSRVAAALGIEERTLRNWVDAGRVEVLPTPRSAWRYISLQEIARLAAEGWPVSWDKLLS